MIAPREIEAAARAYNTQAEIIREAAHNCMLESNWQSVAERILGWLNEQHVANASPQVAELADVTQL